MEVKRRLLLAHDPLEMLLELCHLLHALVKFDLEGGVLLLIERGLHLQLMKCPQAVFQFRGVAHVAAINAPQVPQVRKDASILCSGCSGVIVEHENSARVVTRQSVWLFM